MRVGVPWRCRRRPASPSSLVPRALPASIPDGKPKLHILTAISRPALLPDVVASVIAATRVAPEIPIIWHGRFDIARDDLGGHALKNAMLAQITDGWVWVLDDDNLMHIDFLRVIHATTTRHPMARMIVCESRFEGKQVRRMPGVLLREGHLDIAQVVIRREAIGTTRMPERPRGDGAFIEEIASRLPAEAIVRIEQPIVSYNALFRQARAPGQVRR
jgi:hypothetical protein